MKTFLDYNFNVFNTLIATFGKLQVLINVINQLK